MDIEAFTLRERMLELREKLLAVEEYRLAGRAGTMPDELDKCLDSIIDEVEHGKGSNSKAQEFRKPAPR
jgi:hypothetical protein